ncbi:hypothetical protein SAMN04489812_2494 [Microlunatus soli]|uniref:Uncharacterized protein n=2 Tax=Microlunatus soli TaxID=630515 RepID=A0A1H1TT77_9ACTN|nr:hypothetical protein SAMN04489812_2494 [Microlunatus soli]
MAEWNIPSVAHIAADPRAVLQRFRRKPMPFSFGDERPEGVLLTVDQFDDLDGSEMFPPGDVLTPDELATQLPDLVERIRAGTFAPVTFGEDGKPEAMVMSTSQYRDLRGDDHPPEGVDDDPTKRVYNTEPLPTSKAIDFDELVASFGPEAVASHERAKKQVEEELQRRADEGH